MKREGAVGERQAAGSPGNVFEVAVLREQTEEEPEHELELDDNGGQAYILFQRSQKAREVTSSERSWRSGATPIKRS